jgi:HEAT repeat protein
MLEDVFKKNGPGMGPADEPSPRRKGPRIGRPILLLPLLFAALLASIVYFFGLLSFDARRPGDLLAEIRTSSGERRALAAFELSRMERLRLSAGAREAFVSEALRTFQEERGKDSRVRRALALTLGRVGDRRAVPGLLQALDDPDAETQMYVVWALGAIGAPEAAGPILPKLGHEDAGIRKMAAFSLGQIGNPAAVPALRVALQDSTPDVTWNAAVALARLRDRSALPILMPLLLARSAIPGLTPRQTEEFKVNIIRSLRGLDDKAVEAALRQAAESDPSPRVRGEARRLEAGSPEPTLPPLPPP